MERMVHIVSRADIFTKKTYGSIHFVQKHIITLPIPRLITQAPLSDTEGHRVGLFPAYLLKSV